MKAYRTLKTPTWTFEVPKCSKYHANERLKCQNVTNTYKYHAKWKWKANMAKCSKYHAKWQVLVPNCCKYKAHGTRKESRKQIQNLRQKKNTQNYSTPIIWLDLKQCCSDSILLWWATMHKNGWYHIDTVVIWDVSMILRPIGLSLHVWWTDMTISLIILIWR